MSTVSSPAHVHKKNLVAPEADSLKPVWLHDNLSEVLFFYLGMFYLLLAVISIPSQVDILTLPGFSSFKETEWVKNLNEKTIISPFVVFWSAVVALIIFFVLYRFNLSRKNFLIVFGLLGTFLGIPATLEIVGYGHFFETLGDSLGSMRPQANAGAYGVATILCFVPWIGNYIWSRTNTRAKLDASGLTVYYADGSSTNFDLIGLVTEEKNFDYGEWFISGNGRLVFKLKNGTILFKMDRVIGLYWTPVLFWRKSLASRISYALSFQGKVASVDVSNEIRQQNDDMVDHHDDFDGDDNHGAVPDNDREFK